jgi:FAD binding domain
MPHLLPAPLAGRDVPAISLPRHTTYDAARAAWNLVADQRPAAVAVATSTAQVVTALEYAADHDLRIAVQATGHQTAALPPLDDALLLRTALHDRVRVDPATRRAYMGAGARWEDVVRAAAPSRLAAPHASAPGVGVVGSTLGGGLGFYGRRFGLAANHVHALEVVTADGVVRCIDAHREPELFWALRGGGGGFGVVTSMELGLLPLETDGVLYAGATFWPLARARDVMTAWLEWCRTAPEGVTTTLRVLRLRPVEGVPAALHGAAVVAIDGVVSEDAYRGEDVVAPLRAVDGALLDTWDTASPIDVLWLHMDPEVPLPTLADHRLLEDLDERAVDLLVELTGADSGCPLVQVELRQLGGALGRAPDGAGARGSLEGAFSLSAVGVPWGGEHAAVIDAWLRDLVDAVEPWSTGTMSTNFAERGDAGARAFASAEVYDRLRRARAAWDPDERFVTAHPIAPATEVPR